MSSRHQFLDNARLGWLQEITPRQSEMCLVEECKPEFTGQINKPRRNALKTAVTKASDGTIPKIWNEYFNKHI